MASFSTSSNTTPAKTVTEERNKMKWFLLLCVSILFLTLATDLIISFYGKTSAPKHQAPPLPSPSSTASSSPTLVPTKPILPTGQLIACPMDAKMCPDGKTYVGRSGPNCDFVPCPK